MRKIAFCLFFVCSMLFAHKSFADYDNCFSKETADLLAKKALKQYIISYCDCCAEANSAFIPAVLLYVKSTNVVPCEYDQTQYSVEFEYDVAGEFGVNKGKIDVKSYKPSSESQIMKTLTLNYHFFVQKGKAKRLYDLVGVENKYTKCIGLDKFPSAKEVKDDKNYGKWLKSAK